MVNPPPPSPHLSGMAVPCPIFWEGGGWTQVRLGWVRLDYLGVSGSLSKSWSLLLRLKSNLVAQIGDIFFFLLGHFDI